MLHQPMRWDERNDVSKRRRVTARRERVRRHSTLTQHARPHSTPRWAAHTTAGKHTRQAPGRAHTEACRASRGLAVASTIRGGRNRKGRDQPGSLRLGTATKPSSALPPDNGYSHKVPHQASPSARETRKEES